MRINVIIFSVLFLFRFRCTRVRNNTEIKLFYFSFIIKRRITQNPQLRTGWAYAGLCHASSLEYVILLYRSGI